MASEKDQISGIDLSFFALTCFREILVELRHTGGRETVRRVIDGIEHSVARTMATDGMVMGDKHAIRAFINGLKVVERGES